MFAEIIRHPNLAVCERNGVDQGIHNVIAHLNVVNVTAIYTQATGRVAHMQVAAIHVSAVLCCVRAVMAGGREHFVLFITALGDHMGKGTFWDHFLNNHWTRARL